MKSLSEAPTWVVSKLDVEALKGYVLEDLDWSMQITVGEGAVVWKDKARTGLIRLEIASYSPECRDLVMAAFADVGNEITGGGLVDTTIRYMDGSSCVGWVLFHLSEKESR